VQTIRDFRFGNEKKVVEYLATKPNCTDLTKNFIKIGL
jgi:hypothetical protein